MHRYVIVDVFSGTPLEGNVEVVATVEGESEKRLLGEFRV